MTTAADTTGCARRYAWHLEAAQCALDGLSEELAADLLTRHSGAATKTAEAACRRVYRTHAAQRRDGAR